MKAPLILFTLCLLPGPLASGATVVTGQTEAEVIEALGKPMGTIELRDKTLLLYPQGEVTLKEGTVTDVDLMTAEQFAADQERLREEREQWLAEKERRAERHREEGEAIRADKLKSGAFAALPAKDRVDYWRSFQIRYPEIDVSEQIASALEGYESELQELRSQQRIAELESRVAQAEREAAAARLETEQLREETERTQRNNRFYGLRYYTDPVIDHRYYYRPPTVTIYTDGTNRVITHQSKGVQRQQAESVAEKTTRILNEAR